MLEKDVEKKCGAIAKRHGCLWLKWSSPSVRGVPDRLLIYPDGTVVFVEVKRPGGRPTKLQLAWHRKLRLQGCGVVVISDPKALENLVANA